MTEETIFTPTGYLIVTIKIDETISDSPSALGLTRAVITTMREGQRKARDSVIGIGRKQTILLSPGKYTMYARLAGLVSGEIEVDIIEGRSVEKIFHFGSQPR